MKEESVVGQYKERVSLLQRTVEDAYTQALFFFFLFFSVVPHCGGRVSAGVQIRVQKRKKKKKKKDAYLLVACVSCACSVLSRTRARR